MVAVWRRGPRPRGLVSALPLVSALLVTCKIFVLLAALAQADNAVVFCEKHADCQPGLYMPFPVSILSAISCIPCTIQPLRES